MKRKSSINIQKTTTREFWHNSREHKTNNSIFSTEDNYCSVSGAEAKEAFETYLEQAEKRYKERTGQRLQKSVNKLYSAVINLTSEHSEEDVWKVANYLAKTLGTKILQIAVHRDEGHVNKQGNKVINYHAHVIFAGVDENGYSVGKKLNKQYLRELQTKTAELLGMERGQPGSKKKRLDWRSYKEYKKRVEKELSKTITPIQAENKRLQQENKLLQAKLKQQKKQIQNLQEELREANLFAEYAQKDIERLQEQNKQLKLTVNNLKEEISNIRKQMIEINKQDKIFDKEDYQYLSKLKKLLKKDNLSEIYKEVKKIKNKINKKQKISDIDL